MSKTYFNTQCLLGAQWFYTKMYSNTWSITLAAFKSFLAEISEELIAFCKEFEAYLNLFWITLQTYSMYVIFTIFTCVPLFTVILIPLYCLYLITAPSTVKKCLHWFKLVYCNIFTSTLFCMAKNCNIYNFLLVSKFQLYTFAVYFTSSWLHFVSN